MDSTSLVMIFLFVGVMQLSAKTSIKPATASLLVVLPPFFITSLIKWILIAGKDAPLWGNVLTFSGLLLLMIQFLLGVLVFKGMKNADDSIEKWLIWSVAGIALIIFIAPFVIQSIFKF